MNAYVAGGIALLWMASIGGAYAYRAHQDAGAVEAQETKDALDAARMVQASMEAAQIQSQNLQDQANARATALQSQIDKSRSDYARIPPVRVRQCPLVAGDVSMLVAPYDPGRQGVANPAGSGPGSQEARTVDAGAIITACELNKGAFERNVDRLKSCIAAYDAARKLINGGPPHANAPGQE